MVELMGDYIPMEEAMALTGYKRANITLLCRQGKIAGAKKVGNRWLIPRAELLAYVPGPQGFAAHPEKNPQKRDAQPSALEGTEENGGNRADEFHEDDM